MGISDIFNAKKIKEENEQLRGIMTPEMQNAVNLQNYIAQLQNQITELQKQDEALTKKIEKSSCELAKQNQAISEAKSQLISFQEDILIQDFGLYHPRFNFMNADEYKEHLLSIRANEKELIKQNRATTYNPNWTVNGSLSKGTKMVKDMQKLLLRAFNSECDDVISKVKYNNIEASEKRITASCNAISKLGTIMGVAITEQYYNCKISELYLAHEYNVKKQEEKEAQKEARARMREEARLQKELEEQRKKVEKEQLHYQNALTTILKQINESGETADLLEKKQELERQLGEIHHTLADLDYREANQRAGYVYIISNIGAFGENVYKIGMTRRLDPQDRVDELGDASVPFNFDVHAMIFSDDAPALENALHKAFEDRKVNLVNHRREFFYASLDEIKAVIRANYDKTVEFIDVPDAEQYRTSLKMRQQGIVKTDAGTVSNIPDTRNRQKQEPELTQSELSILEYIKNMLNTNEDITYHKTSDYVNMQIGKNAQKWICRIYFQQDNTLLLLHKFDNVKYECEYYFDEPEQLLQIRNVVLDVFYKCLSL